MQLLSTIFELVAKLGLDRAIQTEIEETGRS
jgi:hypothetical protein